MGRSHGQLWHRLVVLLLCLPAGAILAGALPRVTPLETSVWPAAAVLFGLHAAARRYPIRVVREHEVSEVVTSTAFGFALLLLVPAPMAVIGLTLTALVPAREAAGPRWIAMLAGLARTALVFGAAALALALLSSLVSLRPEQIPTDWSLLLVILPAGVIAYLVETLFVVVTTAARQGARLGAVLRQDRPSHDLLTYLLLVSLAPVILLVSEHSLLLAPILLLAVFGLYRSSRLLVVRQHEANHDPLTGLANRRHIEARLRALVETGELDDRFSVLLLDLDRFKEVNDQLGHHVGDQLLAQVGARLRALEGIDLASRLGGDEFAFILRGPADHDQLVEVGKRLVDEVSQPYVVADLRLAVGASIGIATYPDHALDAPSLLRRADSAMYSAKRCGVPVGIATTTHSETLPGRVSLLGELEEAMRRGQLKLDYQPKVSVDDGRITGVESLLRWHHPEHGLVPPDAFVSTVEHTELISPLTRHVLTLALEDAARWAVAGVEVPISVNISTRDLRDSRFARDLAELLDRHGFDPGALTLEITETAVQHEPEHASEVLAELREIGVALSIDDFGTGYSSLAALRQLPVNELKIDRTFVLGIADLDGSAIVHSVIQLAHALGLTVVAEGVEHESELSELRRHGCDEAQGFLLSRPLPAHLVPAWVRARREEHVAARGPFARSLVDEDGRPPVRIEAV